MKNHDSNYNTSSIHVLEGLDAVRKRPGMYIGSTDSRGLQHCLWEIIDNAVDEAISGYCDYIDITLLKDGSISVYDNGRGIPVDVDKNTKMSGIEIVFTKLHAGGKFGSSSYKNSGGLHGVGASVVNALSKKLEVVVYRGENSYQLDFSYGKPGHFIKNHFEPGNNLIIKKSTKIKKGTLIKYQFDDLIFNKDSKIDLEQTKERAKQTSYLVSGLTIKIIDEQTNTNYTYNSKGGIIDLIKEGEQVSTLISSIINISGSGSYTEVIPVLENNKLISKEVSRTLDVEIAMAYDNKYDHNIKSFVNIIATPKGGTHIMGFNKGINKAFNEIVREEKILKINEDNLTLDDIYEGLHAAVLVKISEPQFEGQTKEILGTTAATNIVMDLVYNEIITQYKSKKERKNILLIANKIVSAMRARIFAKQQRENIRRKNALENNSSLPSKLSDCRTRDLDLSELILIEGDSAGGTVKASRDSEFQALMPLRGKILNVYKASEKQMLDNTECAAIISAIGAGSGDTFKIENIRYGKLIFMTDADVDGSHIRCLLLTLCYRYLYPLLAEGRVYAAMPPLYRIEVSNSKEYIYCYTDAERDYYIESLKIEGKIIKAIQRYKGLGEMDADQLHETTMDIDKRKLRKIEIEDSAKASKAFELLMGNEVGGRRDFIINNGGLLDRDKIDI